MATFDDIAQFVREQTGYHGRLSPDTTLQGDIGVYGDDVDDLLSAYAERFGDDLSSYLWYFHTGEEGFFSPGGLFFPAPNRRVREIPISVGMLHDFAARGRWEVKYPSHQPPGFRADILINWVLFVGLLLGCLFSGLFRGR
jgi:hypothetical protein